MNRKLLILLVLLGLSATTFAQDSTAVPAPEATPELTTSDEYISRATESYNQSEFRFAIEDYTSAIALDASNMQAYLGRARANLELNLYDKVFADTNLVIGLVPDNALAFTLRGFAYLMTNDAVNGQADIDRAKQIDPVNPEPYNYLGLYDNFKKLYNDALVVLNQSLVLDPNQPLTLNSRAVTYFYLGKTSEAMQDLNSAVSMNPNSGFLYTNRASLYRANNDLTSALKDLTQALAVQPTYALAYLQRAFVYIDMGNSGDKAQLKSFYNAALNDINQYVVFSHPDDVYPEVLQYKTQLENLINTP